MTNETKNHEFIVNIDTANEEVERLSAENADLKAKLAGSASTKPTPTPAKPAPTAATEPERQLTAGGAPLTGLSRLLQGNGRTAEPPAPLTGLARASKANQRLQPKQK